MLNNIFAIVIFFFLLTNSVMASSEGKSVYIVGYGSLMLSLTRTVTAPDVAEQTLIPVRINGYERTWNLWLEQYDMRMLAAEEKAGRFVNGLAYRVNPHDLWRFDAREGHRHYRRIRLPLSAVEFYNPQDSRWFFERSDEVEVYMYVALKHDITDGGNYLGNGYDHMNKKITRSYLDVVLAGCMEVDDRNQLHGRFIGDCHISMGLRKYHIDDDRLKPRYPRAPANLLNSARKRVRELEDYLEQDWSTYMNRMNTVCENSQL